MGISDFLFESDGAMLPMLPIFQNFKFQGLQSRSNAHFELRLRNAYTLWILAYQFSLSHPGVQIFSTTLNLAHPVLYYNPDFQTLLRPCFLPCLFFLSLSFYPGWNEKTKLVATSKVYLCLCIYPIPGHSKCVRKRQSWGKTCFLFSMYNLTKASQVFRLLQSKLRKLLNSSCGRVVRDFESEAKTRGNF